MTSLFFRHLHYYMCMIFLLSTMSMKLLQRWSVALLFDERSSILLLDGKLLISFVFRVTSLSFPSVFMADDQFDRQGVLRNYLGTYTGISCLR